MEGDNLKEQKAKTKPDIDAVVDLVSNPDDNSTKEWVLSNIRGIRETVKTANTKQCTTRQVV